MKKQLNKGAANLIIIIIVVAVLVGGVIAWQYLGTLKGEREEETSAIEIPQECQQFQNDTCSLFSCMVDLCWCDTGIIPSPILVKGDTETLNEQAAIAIVDQYLKSNNSEYTANKAVRLNSFFFNVFVYDVENNEKVFTVGADGTILATICGI